MNVMDLLSLKGKTAVVTGGYGLYGSQITTALAEAGATVVTASRNLEKNVSFAASLREQGLLHRDVRPENLFRDAEGQFRLGDLGVAALCLKSALQGAWLNVLINIGILKDKEMAETYRLRGEALLEQGKTLADEICEQIEESL